MKQILMATVLGLSVMAVASLSLAVTYRAESTITAIMFGSIRPTEPIQRRLADHRAV